MRVEAPTSLLAWFQAIEYMRAFLGGRIAYSFLNSLLVISGAFGVFRRDVVIEAGGSLSAFQSGVYVATREVSEGHARYAIYRFAEDFALDAAAATFAIERTAADRALKPQPWECAPPPAGSSEGAQIIEATVGIGGSLAVGSAQNGSRNIIPITGGTFTGLGTSSALEGDVVHISSLRGEVGGAEETIILEGEAEGRSLSTSRGRMCCTLYFITVIWPVPPRARRAAECS